MRKRKPISFKVRAQLQQEIQSECPFCPSKDVGHFQFHHINGDTSNNERSNLFMICPTCHSKITKGDISFDDVIKKKAKLTSIPEDVFIKVEIESEFPGGAGAWTRFLRSNLVYPKEAIKRDIQGEVVVEFIVDQYGLTNDVIALSGPDVLRDEALRIIKQSPRWIPAHQNGKNVKSFKKQPIIFRLE